MLARHAVLLTRLECAVPSSILYSKQNQPVTSLESALTSQPQLVENTATLSLVECALTRLSPATPLECAVPKNLGGGGSFFPFWNSPTVTRRCIHVLSFHVLMGCPFCNPFVLMVFHLMGVPPWSSYYSCLAPSGNQSGQFPQNPYFLTSIPPDSLTSLLPFPPTSFPSLLPYIFASLLPSLQYNRCASIRGRNELQPASRRDPNRLRASLLGRQHHRDLRAPFLLWRLRLACQLSPR